MRNTIFYVTSNHGKFEEVRGYIEAHEPSIELLQFDTDLEELQTLDQLAIAKSKASQAWKMLQKPLLVDDAAIYFDAYNNFPGTLTKFVHQGIGYDGIFKLLDENNKAHFLLQMVYVDEKRLQAFEGFCEGVIIKPKEFKAHPSLPWDAIFIPEGTNKTYSELRESGDVDEYLYRIRALKKFLAWFKQSGNGAATLLSS